MKPKPGRSEHQQSCPGSQDMVAFTVSRNAFMGLSSVDGSHWVEPSRTGDLTPACAWAFVVVLTQVLAIESAKDAWPAACQQLEAIVNA
jgi:hypothetical protein